MDRFIHMPEYRVIICKECRYAVLPSHIDSHFQKDEHKLDKKERKRIESEVAVEVNGLIGNEVALKHSEFPFPLPTAKPIPELAPAKEGVKCTFTTNGIQCRYVCYTEQHMQVHSKQEHRWKQGRKGRPKKGSAKEVPWQTGIYCQRFFIQGPQSRYFEVQPPASARRPGPAEIQSRESQFEKRKKQLESELKAMEDENKKTIIESEESREPNPWLRRVGWVGHTSGLNPEYLREWIEPPGEEEPELQVMCKAFDWMIQGAQFTAVQDVVSQAALFEVNKKETDTEAQMPFDSWMDQTTIRAYTQVWRQVLCYLWRAETEGGEASRPKYKLTIKQRESIDHLQVGIEYFQQWQEIQGVRSPEGDQNGEAESEEEIKQIKIIQTLVLDFCITLLDHQLQDNEYQSGLISALAVLGIKEKGGWSDALEYTPKYSAIIKLARLMVVQRGYEKRQDEIDGKVINGIREEQAKEESRSNYHHVRKMVREFMTMAHDGQDPTPMQWIYKARSYGFKIRYTTTAGGCIQWIGDTVLYQKVRFNMSEVRAMVHGLIEEARAVLFSDLMMVDPQWSIHRCLDRCPASIGIPWPITHPRVEWVGHF